MGHAQHALDRTYSAADTGAHCTPDDAADRAGDPVSLVRALLRTPHDALGMTRAGDRAQDEQRRKQHEQRLRHER